MKIIIVTERFYPLIGGAEVRYLQLANHLTKLGVEVHVLTGKGDIVRGNNAKSHLPTLDPQVSLHYAGSFTNYPPYIFNRSIFDIVKFGINTGKRLGKLNQKETFDVVEINSLPHLHLPLIYNLCNIKYSLTIHEYWGNHWNKWFSSLSSLLEQYNLQSAEHLVCVSEFTQNRLPEHFSRKANIIPNGVSQIYLNLTDNSPDHPVFLVLGRIVSHKKIEDVVIPNFFEVRNKYPNAELHIVGEGRKLHILRKKYSTTCGIVLHGFLQQDQLIQVMEYCNVYVSASTREGSGISCLEAMGAGMPTVVLNAPLNAMKSEWIKDGKNGLLADVEEFATKMKLAYLNRYELGNNAREFAKKFTWEKQAEKLLKLYEGLS